MTVIPGDNQDTTKVGLLSYSVESFEPKKLTILVMFENPLYISNGDTADVLQIIVKDRDQFVS